MRKFLPTSVPKGLLAAIAAVVASGVLASVTSGSVGLGFAVASLVACGAVGVALLVSTPDELVIDLREPEHARTRPRVLRAQLLFANADAGRIQIDAMVLESSTGAGPLILPGTPVSLEMSMPTAGWFSASVADLIEGWAEDGELVDLQLVRCPAGPRARLAREEARLTLDLQRIDGVPAPLALGA